MKLSTARAEWIIVGTIVGIVTGLAISATWVFRARPASQVAPSLWSELLADRITLGLIRLLLCTGALYALVSIGVMTSRRRWVRAISTTGVEVDASAASGDAVAALERDLLLAVAQRDEARRLAWRLGRG
ncbi:MAG: hypothetical protein WEB06_13765 [Actinomycetota bacterium]